MNAADDEASPEARAALRHVGADDLAALTRPLLDALQEISGIAVTFLCRVDEERDTEAVLLVHRAEGAPDVREGAEVAWSSSMCRYACDQGASAVTDASQRWVDCGAGVCLGLLTHLTVPVVLSDGTLWGVLCASDAVVHDDVADHVPTFRVFARLVAAEVERAASLSLERSAAAEVRRRSRTDDLTSAGSRASIAPWLVEAVGRVGDHEHVVVALVDVDRFKDVNDDHGHAAGDAVLVELVARLTASARTHDLVARLGGDELVVAAVLPSGALAAFEDRVAAACAFDLGTAAGGRVEVRCSVGFGTSREAGADDILALADARMYRDKARPGRTGGAVAEAPERRGG